MAIKKQDIRIQFQERVDENGNVSTVQCYDASYIVTDSEGNNVKHVDMALVDATESEIEALADFVALVDTKIESLES